MCKYDFHSHRPSDVETIVHNVVGAVRLRKQPLHVEFITGRGSHRDLVMGILEEYNLSPSFKLGNDGVVVVEVE